VNGIEVLKNILENPDYVHYVGMVVPAKPGVRLCFTKLEYTYFAPGTSKNNEFHFAAIKWKGVVWAIASIPAKDAHLMDKVAAETGIRISPGPYVITTDGEEFFSLGTGKVFHLENTEEERQIYDSNPSEIQHLLEEEAKEIRIIEEMWERTKVWERGN
jgi:hypothetical protein